MSSYRKLTALTLGAALLAAAGTALADEERSFSFRAETPPLSALAQADGFAEVKVEGFFRRDGAVGAPDVPTRTLLVAIPPGATPRLEVRLAGTRSFRQVLPRPVADVRLEGEPPRADEMAERGFAERTVRHYEPAPRHYDGQGSYPARVAWLGETGLLRDQRYVELHLAPVRFDRGLRGLQVDSALDITVHFDGDYALGAPPATTDQLEAVYRQTFINYDQGRAFRLSAVGLRPGTDEHPPAPAVGPSTTGPIRRIRVSADGPVRLDHAHFLAEAPEFLATDPTRWRVTNQGLAVPLHLHQVAGDAALLEAGEWLQFYGQAFDDEPETLPNHVNVGNPLLNLHEVHDETDENGYFLTIEAAAEPTMAVRDATPPPVGTPEPFFVDTARAEVDNFFWPLEGAAWFWTPFVSEASGPRSESIPLPGLLSGTDPLQLRVRLRGFGDCAVVDPDHKTQVRLRNSLAQTLVLPASNPDNVANWNEGVFDGNTLFVHDFAWTHSGVDPQVTHPLTVVVDAADILGACATGGTLSNDNLLDWIEVDYRRSFAANGDRLEFEVPDAAALFEVTGFTSGAIQVYEITEQIGASGVVDTVRLTGVEPLPDGPGFKARFRTDDDLTGGTRRFVAVAPAGVALPTGAGFEADRLSTLIEDTTQADLVVIAHPAVVPSSCSEGANTCSHDADCTTSETDRCVVDAGSNLDLLLARRAGQGISSRVVWIQDVYDEFNFGLSGPSAIRNFAAWLLAGGWSGEPPAYLMLLGDGSYDYKAGPAGGNFVPTQMMIKDGANIPSASILPHYASDNQLAAVAGGDFLADLTVGRVSARTEAEAEAILGKILAIEESPGSGSWTTSALFISDRGANNDTDGSEAAGFQGMNSDAGDLIGAPPPAGCAVAEPYTKTFLRYWSDYCGGLMSGCTCDTDPNCAMRQDIVGHVNGTQGDGAAMVQFAGHGNYDLWSNDVLFCVNEQLSYCDQDDTGLLTNSDRLPWLIAHNCLTGGFHSKEIKSFGEQWLRRLFGGASAVYAPSGLGFQFIGNAIIPVIWGDVFGSRKERVVGVPVMNSQIQLCTQGSIEACQFYVLLGDPTARLAFPDIGPASALSATPSTGLTPSVELSWTASTTAGATYDVYRAKAGQAYQSLACGLAAPSYTDGSVVHASTYRYYVVAKAGGFESAWSNFNTGCTPTPGPDCVQAEVLNLVPPIAPTGVTVTDAETGGSLVVQWNANPEPDIAQYVIHYGTTPALGQTATAFNTVTQATLSGLQNGIPYHVSLQAKNTSGTFSALSGQVIEAPNLILGVKSPAFIDDLRLSKSGSAAVLSWGAVTQDIYGKPATIASYEVYRSTDPLFVPAPSNRIGTSVVPGFTDPGALAAGPDYHYLVRALDTAGNPGGLGRQLPQGILLLELDRSQTTPGALVLSWPPVTADFDGHATSISHYEIWAAAAPFSRADVEAGAPGLSLIVPMVAGSAAQIVPPAPNQYYSVLPVDTRGNRGPF